MAAVDTLFVHNDDHVWNKLYSNTRILTTNSWNRSDNSDISDHYDVSTAVLL